MGLRLTLPSHSFQNSSFYPTFHLSPSLVFPTSLKMSPLHAENTRCSFLPRASVLGFTAPCVPVCLDGRLYEGLGQLRIYFWWLFPQSYFGICIQEVLAVREAFTSLPCPTHGSQTLICGAGLLQHSLINPNVYEKYRFLGIGVRAPD